MSVGVGLGVLAELMEEEVDEVVGPKGKHDPDRVAVRHGREAGEVTLGGRRVAVQRPRVRTAEGRSERAAACDLPALRRSRSALADDAGADAGIVGIRERTALLAGSLEARADDGLFRVRTECSDSETSPDALHPTAQAGRLEEGSSFVAGSATSSGYVADLSRPGRSRPR